MQQIPHPPVFCHLLTNSNNSNKWIWTRWMPGTSKCKWCRWCSWTWMLMGVINLTMLNHKVRRIRMRVVMPQPLTAWIRWYLHPWSWIPWWTPWCWIKWWCNRWIWWMELIHKLMIKGKVAVHLYFLELTRCLLINYHQFRPKLISSTPSNNSKHCFSNNLHSQGPWLLNLRVSLSPMIKNWRLTTCFRLSLPTTWHSQMRMVIRMLAKRRKRKVKRRREVAIAYLKLIRLNRMVARIK